jgi:hypothetical protein
MTVRRSKKWNVINVIYIENDARYQSVSISGVISNIYWHASNWSSISFSHWQCPSDRELKTVEVVEVGSTLRTGPAWWVMARSHYVWTIRKACAPAMGTLIGWWWHKYLHFLWNMSECACARPRILNMVSPYKAFKVVLFYCDPY